MTGAGGLEGDGGGFGIADFANHKTIGSLTKECAQGDGEGKAAIGGDIDLLDAREADFDGILGGEDLEIILGGEVQEGVEGSGLAGTGGAGDEAEAFPEAEALGELIGGGVIEPQAGDGGGSARVEEAQDHGLTVDGGDYGEPHLGGLVPGMGEVGGQGKGGISVGGRGEVVELGGGETGTEEPLAPFGSQVMERVEVLKDAQAGVVACGKRFKVPIGGLWKALEQLMKEGAEGGVFVFVETGDGGGLFNGVVDLGTLELLPTLEEYGRAGEGGRIGTAEVFIGDRQGGRVLHQEVCGIGGDQAQHTFRWSWALRNGLQGRGILWKSAEERQAMVSLAGHPEFLPKFRERGGDLLAALFFVQRGGGRRSLGRGTVQLSQQRKQERQVARHGDQDWCGGAPGRARWLPDIGG